MHGQCNVRPTVTFQAAGHHRPFTQYQTILLCERHMCVNNLPKVEGRKNYTAHGDWVFFAKAMASAGPYANNPHLAPER